MYAANRLMNTGAMRTGAIAADWTPTEAGLGGLLLAGALVAGVWFVFLRPIAEPAARARVGIRERELQKIKTLDEENKELRGMLGSIDCSVRDAGARGKCKNGA